MDGTHDYMLHTAGLCRWTSVPSLTREVALAEPKAKRHYCLHAAQAMVRGHGAIVIVVCPPLLVMLKQRGARLQHSNNIGKLLRPLVMQETLCKAAHSFSLSLTLFLAFSHFGR